MVGAKAAERGLGFNVESDGLSSLCGVHHCHLQHRGEVNDLGVKSGIDHREVGKEGLQVTHGGSNSQDLTVLGPTNLLDIDIGVEVNGITLQLNICVARDIQDADLVAAVRGELVLMT